MLCHYEAVFLRVSASLSLINMTTVLMVLNVGNYVKVKTDYSILS